MKRSAHTTPDEVLATAQALRWEVGDDFHEKLMEALYTNANQIADRAVTRPGEKPRFDLDRTIDRVVTNPRWGFLLMILLFTLVPDWFALEAEQLVMLRGFVAYHLVAIAIYFSLRHFKHR